MNARLRESDTGGFRPRTRGVKMPHGPMIRAELREKLKISPVFPFIATFFYAMANVLTLSGVFFTDHLLLAMLMWPIARRLQNSRPRMLVLRRFGNTKADLLLRVAAGGLGMYSRPLWLFDAKVDIPYGIRLFAPDMLFYYVYPFVWITLLSYMWFTSGLSLINKLLFAIWITVMSRVYVAHKAGVSQQVLILLVFLFIIVVMILVHFFGDHELINDRPILSVIISPTSFALILLVFLCSMTTIPRALFHWIYRRRLIESEADLDVFVREINGKGWLPRYLPIAPVHMSYIACVERLWPAVVYEAIGHCSVVLADISDLSDNAALAWELQEVQVSSAPLILTCQEEKFLKARDSLSSMKVNRYRIFTYKYAGETRPIPGRDFDADELSAIFLDVVESHLGQELAYLPRRHSRADATARWFARTTFSARS